MSNSKIALVTGASRGLGKDMALSIAQKGLDVILTYKSNTERAEQVVQEIIDIGQQAVAMQLDITNFNHFGTFMENVHELTENKFGRTGIDYLINNAGIGINAPFQETTEEQLDSMINIQFKGTYLFTQAALKILKEGGGIINISTGLTRFSGPGFSAYASMKGAIETLTRYQAKELGVKNIRSNVVAPGAIETDFGGGVVRDNETMNKTIASLTALGRVGLPEDIGSVVAFLCTDDAHWINAQRIEVSGGQMI